MPHRTPVKERKRDFKNIDVMNNNFYSKFLISIMAGHDTMKKQQEFRKHSDMGVSQPAINVQLGHLIDNQYIMEDSVHRKNNEKRYLVNYHKVAEHFWQYVDDLLRERENEHGRVLGIGKDDKHKLKYTQSKIAKSSAQGFKESGPAAAEYQQIIQSIDSRYPQVDYTKKEKDMILRFLMEALQEYIRVSPPSLIEEYTFSFHFDQIIKEMLFEFTGKNLAPRYKESETIGCFLFELGFAYRPTRNSLHLFMNRWFAHEPLNQQRTRCNKPDNRKS